MNNVLSLLEDTFRMPDKGAQGLIDPLSLSDDTYFMLANTSLLVRSK